MSESLLPHLFRSEYRRIVSVLTHRFGLAHIEVAEDIASEAFFLAASTWGQQGIPEHPKAWLYKVAQNKAKDFLRREKVFSGKIKDEVKSTTESHATPFEINEQTIEDSELRMLFAVCNLKLTTEMQLTLALRILFGLSISEIAEAFFQSKEVVNKRLFRAKEKWKEEQIELELPSGESLPERIESVMLTLYLLYNEGYYSVSQQNAVRRELCYQAMHLAFSLSRIPAFRRPSLYALLALMCFQSSRLEARWVNNEMIMFDDQDRGKWDADLIEQGEQFMQASATGDELSRYHLEAAIAYWHTRPENNFKWHHILSYYTLLLKLQPSESLQLNRIWAMYKAMGKEAAQRELFAASVGKSHWYYALLAAMEEEDVPNKAIDHWESALKLARSDAERGVMQKRMDKLKNRA